MHTRSAFSHPRAAARRDIIDRRAIIRGRPRMTPVHDKRSACPSGFPQSDTRRQDYCEWCLKTTFFLGYLTRLNPSTLATTRVARC